MSRVAIVTGGTRGIGLATCRKLTAEGIKVVAFFVADDNTAAQAAREYGFYAIRCDVSDYQQCQEAVAAVEQAHGPVDILVNNAGITQDTMLHKMTVEQWDRVLRTDLYSVFNMTRQVITGMRERGHGRIVSISSVNAQKGQPGQTNYCAAKAGIIGFSKALALECAAKGVTVNVVAPGYVATDMVAAVPADILEKIKQSVPLGRLGEPMEIARCVAFLVSEDAGFITGATLAVNGGLYMSG